MATETESCNSMESVALSDVSGAISRVKHLREIGETIDALLSRFESEEKLDQPTSDTSRTSQTMHSPRNWVFDVLDVILGKDHNSDVEDDEKVNDPKDILRRHYEECPWFYQDAADNNNNCNEVNRNVPIQQEHEKKKKKKNDDSSNPEAILRKHRQLNPSFYTAQRSESLPDLDHPQSYYLAESKPWSSNSNIARSEVSKDRFHAGAKKMNFFEKFYRQQMRRYNSSNYKSR